jgi:NADH dehydrogenase
VDAQRIVILGGGFAGAYCARELARHLRGTTRPVLLIDRNNYFVFHPLLVEAGTGHLEPRHTVVGLRAMIRPATFRMAEVVTFDPAAREVLIRIPELGRDERVAYDHLVVALGSVTRLPDVPGLREYAMEMKSLADAIALRDRMVRMLELADACMDQAARRSLLHLVVVGGNFTGAEVAGEFDAFIRSSRRHYRGIGPEDPRVTLVEHADRILPALGPDLGDYAADHMRRRGIDVITGDAAVAIEPGRIRLRSGRTLDARTVIWCAGIAPSPALAAMPLPRDDRGYILCERDLRVRGLTNVWGIGDAAVNPGPDGQAYPATAQHAVRQGIHCARNIACALSGRPTTPCDIVNQGSLAALGCRTGVARVFGVRLSGFWAWWLWRTVYLLKMPGLGRKLRVAMDWTLDLFAAPDPVGLGIHRPPRNDAVDYGSRRSTP